MLPEYRLNFNLGEFELTNGKPAPRCRTEQDVGCWANTGPGAKGKASLWDDLSWQASSH